MNGTGKYMTAEEEAGAVVAFVGGEAGPRASRWTRLELLLAALCVLLATVCVVLVVIVAAQGILLRPDGEKTVVENTYTVPPGDGQPLPTPPRSSPTPAVPGWPEEGVCLTEGCAKAASRLLNAMDATVDPCDNFFEYACGSWNRLNIIPDDMANYNTFSKLRDHVHAILKDLMEEPISTKDTEPMKKEKYLYQSCMNESQIEALGLQPMRDLLEDLGGWPVVAGEAWREEEVSLMDLQVQLRHYNEESLIKQGVSADDKDSSVTIIYLDQSDLGMPSRDYYHKGDDSAALQSYEKYARDVAIMLGADAARARRDIDDIIQLEIKLANVTVPEAERRDPQKLYNRMTIGDLKRAIPGFDWLTYLQKIFSIVGIKLDESEEIIVKSPDYFKSMISIYQTTDKRTIVNYLIWRILMNHMGNLPLEHRQSEKEYKKKVFGSKSERARWRHCISYLGDNIMGNAVGRQFLQHHFDEDSKTMAKDMIQNIREAFYQVLDDADWMDEPTRVVAREKADAMDEQIGYAESILNDTVLEDEYSEVFYLPDSYFKNIVATLQRTAKQHLKKLREPMIRTKWVGATPIVVNAYYSPSKNQIMLPAGILQPPFYSKDGPKSLNYGGIGMVIGHEITHGFDDRGRQFDKNGNLIQWWDDKVIKHFKERAQCIIDQYSNFTVPEINVRINGRQTVGENIADNGGIKEAFRAYRTWVREQGREEPRLPGMLNFTHNQLFFINFAQVWCGTIRPEAAIRKVRVEVHSPGRFRVVGTLQNYDEFSNAFHCPPGSPMNSPHKCAVW